MNKEFELGNKEIKLERDISDPENTEPILAIESDLELSEKKPGQESDSEKVELKQPKKEEAESIYGSAKKYGSKIDMWKNLLEKHKKDLEKERQDFEKAMEEEKLRGMQN